jgi:ABC-2 type transport system ATP-binding protein
MMGRMLRGRASSPSTPGRIQDVLELVDISRRFREVVALDSVSFSVEEGHMLGFVGPNGAGKTTAMRIALGVLEADRGEVRWRGSPVGAEARRRFGYMPEERGLYPKMRVLDQLVYLGRLHGLEEADAVASARRSIEVLGVSERARDPVQQLSLGNQQRVQLAAALVHGPELLVLDEPFSGLDPGGVDVLSGVLREQVAAGVPVVFSSHQLELVERLCDSVVLIARGRIVAAGAIEDLRSASGRHLVRVEVAGARPGWESQVRSADVVERLADGAVFELREGGSPDDVLDAARASGSVTSFSVVRPSLAQIFREAVSA